MPKHTSRPSTLQAAPFVMISQSFECLCQTAIARGRNSLLKDFECVREKCPALREILVPDNVWEAFKEANSGTLDEAQHKSILLLAFEGGYLKRLTSPIHHYLLEGEKPKRELDRNYKEDLKERWLMQKDNALKRHKVGKKYMGKIVELLCVEWLEGFGWKINGLEALGGEVDIKATAQGGKQYAIEIKYIGQDDEVFKTVVNALQGRGGADGYDLYGASNYILLRAYEAAKQLEKSTVTRIALIVISGDTWSHMEPVLEKGWIDWESPSLNEDSRHWKVFLDRLKAGKKKELYRNIENDLSNVLHTLDQIWICKEQEGFEYSMERLIWFCS